MPFPTNDDQELSVKDTLDRLLNYIRERRAVSFDQLHEYMLSERLRFETNPISTLYFNAAKDGGIGILVDYDQQMIYSRASEPAMATWTSSRDD
jgi:hypothetical protein